MSASAASLARNASGHIYHLSGPFLAWLWPVLILAGLAMLAAAIFLRKKLCVVLGLCPTLAGAIVDRDICLAAGVIVLSCSIWYYIDRD